MLKIQTVCDLPDYSTTAIVMDPEPGKNQHFNLMVRSYDPETRTLTTHWFDVLLPGEGEAVIESGVLRTQNGMRLERSPRPISKQLPRAEVEATPSLSTIMDRDTP
jgi:hypothetical protein